MKHKNTDNCNFMFFLNSHHGTWADRRMVVGDTLAEEVDTACTALWEPTEQQGRDAGRLLHQVDAKQILHRAAAAADDVGLDRVVVLLLHGSHQTIVLAVVLLHDGVHSGDDRGHRDVTIHSLQIDATVHSLLIDGPARNRDWTVLDVTVYVVRRLVPRATYRIDSYDLHDSFPRHRGRRIPETDPFWTLVECIYRDTPYSSIPRRL
jgi:hypothetical protein